MVSGSDEHGTPITVTAEQNGISPQEVVDEYHEMNLAALLKLGCSWATNVDSRGVEYGGALFNRTSDAAHKDKVQQNFAALENAGFFIRKSMEQYYEINPDGTGRFLPDRYVEGTCPSCNEEGARGDQCDACGATYESVELNNPISKIPKDFVQFEKIHRFYKTFLAQK